MANVEICDRCAEFYIHPGTIEQIQTYIDVGSYTKPVKYDLCPKCSKQFQTWIDNKGTVIRNETIRSNDSV